MKLTKKKVLVTALAVSLIAILSFGTLAWFTDTDSVTNDFKITTSEDPDNPDAIFSIDLWERVDTNGDDEPDAAVKIGDVTTPHTYNNILPGDVLAKEPIVENTGVYDQYVRVKVTVTDAQEWTNILAKYQLTWDDLFVGYDDTVWERNDVETVPPTQGNDTLTYVYYLEDILEPDEKATLFTDIAIPEKMTQEDMAKLADGMFSIKIVAEAVQTKNVGNNAIEAFKKVAGN